MKKLVFLSSLCLLIPLMALCQNTWYPVTYNVSFRIKNAGITVNGKFSGLKAELIFSPDKLATSKLKGSVETETLHTGIGMRDKTIKDEHYLDAEKHKLIEISSVKLYPKDIYYAGLFNVTIKGITKEIEIPFEFIPYGDEADFNGSFTINRRDFEVGGSSMTMSDELTVTIKIKAKKQ
jgi:polyisoprenoid-binding protein YceI